MKGKVTSQGVLSLRGKVVYATHLFDYLMSWYVITTPRHQEGFVKQVLDRYPVHGQFGGGKRGKFRTFLPLRKVADTDYQRNQPISKTEPVIPGLVFVQSTRMQLQEWMTMTDTGSRFYTDVTNQPIVVPDYQIRLFKDYLSFVKSEVMVLRKPYSYFLQKKRIRILNGPFAGLEGRLYQIKGNYKLVYGLENTALALSDIAKYTYVEITDEKATSIRYTYYYEMMRTDLEALANGQATDEEVLDRLQHWRQEASVLTLESPLASSYVSLALQQTLADLYDKRHPLFRNAETFLQLKSMYQDTEDYLSVTQTQIDDATLLGELQNRSQLMLRRALYHHDPMEILKEEETTHYAFVRKQEATLAQVILLLSEAEKRAEAFELLVTLFEEISRKLSMTTYQNHLDSTVNYRLRKLLTTAAHHYRLCKEGQSEAFVKQSQQTLRRLLRLNTYQPGGFFDLLKAIRNTPK